MIMDTQLLFSGTIASDGTRSAQAITATAISTNVLDRAGNLTLFPTTEDVGITGFDMWLQVVVIQAFNTLTSLTITLESATDSGLTTGAVVHYTASVALAALTAGATVVRVPMPSGDYKRYVGLRYTVVGSNPTLGSLIAFISPDTQRNVIYQGNFTVDA